MFSISGSTGNSGRVCPTELTGDLTYAQQQLFNRLPRHLVELVMRGVVTAQWALSLPDHLLVRLSKQNLCVLLGDRIIKPEDITDNFNSVHLTFLEYSQPTRALLRDKVITPRQFSTLKRVEIEELFKSRQDQATD